MIEINELTKIYDGERVLDGVSFAAPAGAVTAFLGANGAGKTTTMRILLGLVAAASGSATINGQKYAEISSPRRTVGALLDADAFHPGRSGRDHLRVVCRAAGLASARIDEVLQSVDLRESADRRVGAFSLGMRQRLGIATALLGNPDVLVLDEPANGLDPQGIRWLRTLLREMADDGRTVLLSSHLLGEVAQLADRIVIIDRGRIVHETAVDDIPAGDLEELFVALTGGAR